MLLIRFKKKSFYYADDDFPEIYLLRSQVHFKLKIRVIRKAVVFNVYRTSYLYCNDDPVEIQNRRKLLCTTVQHNIYFTVRRTRIKAKVLFTKKLYVKTVFYSKSYKCDKRVMYYCRRFGVLNTKIISILYCCNINNAN